MIKKVTHQQITMGFLVLGAGSVPGRKMSHSSWWRGGGRLWGHLHRVWEDEQEVVRRKGGRGKAIPGEGGGGPRAVGRQGARESGRGESVARDEDQKAGWAGNVWCFMCHSRAL